MNALAVRTIILSTICIFFGIVCVISHFIVSSEYEKYETQCMLNNKKRAEIKAAITEIKEASKTLTIL